jgi:putative phosphoesterase
VTTRVDARESAGGGDRPESFEGSVAVLTDIHGVLPALDAALGDREVAGAGLVVVTGDITAGPEPAQVLDRLVGLGDRVRLLRGNADRELVGIVTGTDPEVDDPIAPWAASQLRADQVGLLSALPDQLDLEISGFGLVRFCHATPRNDEEVVLVDSALSRWDDVFAPLHPGVRTVVFGHTHMPFVRMVDGRLVVNPGSVGMPYGRPGAHWALLNSGAVTLGRTEFDIEAAREAIREASDYPDVDEWTEYFLYARASDREALQVFGERVPTEHGDG